MKELNGFQKSALSMTCAVLVVFVCVVSWVVVVAISCIEEHGLQLNVCIMRGLGWWQNDENCQLNFQQVEIIHCLHEILSSKFVNNFPTLYYSCILLLFQVH